MSISAIMVVLLLKHQALRGSLRSEAASTLLKQRTIRSPSWCAWLLRGLACTGPAEIAVPGARRYIYDIEANVTTKCMADAGSLPQESGKRAFSCDSFWQKNADKNCRPLKAAAQNCSERSARIRKRSVSTCRA